jgi:hypothetical protein
MLDVAPVTPTHSAPDGERWWGGDGVHVSVRGDYQQLDPAACELWVNGEKQSLASEPVGPSEVGAASLTSRSPSRSRSRTPGGTTLQSCS